MPSPASSSPAICLCAISPPCECPGVAGDRTGLIQASKHLAKRLGAARAYRSLRALSVGRKEPVRVWREGLRDEIGFWEQVLPERVVTDSGYRDRVDPRAPMSDPLMNFLIGRIPEETVSIIDVGAGPLTALGKTYPGKTLRITATDPLASEYVRIMREAGIDPPVAPVACRGEDLLDTFQPGTFDIAFARNALDHCIDPVRVITNMVELVRDGRFVLLRHLRSVAELNLYRGLHQWNFDIEGGRFVIWRTGRERVEMGRVLETAATVECFEEGRWVVCVLTKSAAAGGVEEGGRHPTPHRAERDGSP